MITDDRDTVIARLHMAQQARKASDLAYEHALNRAKAYGLNNSEIARALGVSEAAVRLWFKRHKLRTSQ